MSIQSTISFIRIVSSGKLIIALERLSVRKMEGVITKISIAVWYSIPMLEEKESSKGQCKMRTCGWGWCLNTKAKSSVQAAE